MKIHLKRKEESPFLDCATIAARKLHIFIIKLHTLISPNYYLHLGKQFKIVDMDIVCHFTWHYMTCIRACVLGHYHGRHVSGPHGQGGPMDVMQEGGAVLPQAVDEAAGQGAGELDELIRVEERSHCGVKTGKKKWKLGFII